LTVFKGPKANGAVTADNLFRGPRPGDLTGPCLSQFFLLPVPFGALSVTQMQVGGGNGKTLATVAGAAAGGYAGNKIQQKTQQGDTYTTTEQRCSTAYDRKEEPAGFDVVYEYKGEKHHLHTDKDPGSSLPVKDGKIVVASLKNTPSPTSDP
jgi:hypothetical protein